MSKTHLVRIKSRAPLTGADPDRLVAEGFLAVGADPARLDALDALAGVTTSGTAATRFLTAGAMITDPALVERWLADLPPLTGDLPTTATPLLDHTALGESLALALDPTRPPVPLLRLTFEVASFEAGSAPEGDDPGWLRGFCAQLVAEANEGRPRESPVGRFLGDPFDIFREDGWPVVWGARLLMARTLPMDVGFVEANRREPLIVELARVEVKDPLVLRMYSAVIHPDWLPTPRTTPFGSCAWGAPTRGS